VTRGDIPTPGTTPGTMVVAVGVLQRPDGRFLLAQRPAHRPHGGCWEFPGGKVEAGEPIARALARELAEELGIEVLEARPWRSIPWVYPSGRVRLEVWRVLRWRGVPRGREGQRLAWVPIEELSTLPFPAANRGIVNGLRLPDRCLVTPEPPGPDAGPSARATWLDCLDTALAAGVRLVLLRAKTLQQQPGAWLSLGESVVRRARAAGAQVIANATPAQAEAIGADGVHLTSERLLLLQARPPSGHCWVSAACHTRGELEHARGIGVDFVLLGAVLPTATHPGQAAMGWPRAAALVREAGVPVYLIGGLGPSHCPQAVAIGAQGVAGIRAFWPGS